MPNSVVLDLQVDTNGFMRNSCMRSIRACPSGSTYTTRCQTTGKSEGPLGDTHGRPVFASQHTSNNDGFMAFKQIKGLSALASNNAATRLHTGAGVRSHSQTTLDDRHGTGSQRM